MTSLLGCDSVFLGKWFTTFLRVMVVLSYSRVELLPLRDKGTTMLKNVWEPFI
jgi:hypothetical protein